MLVGALFEKFGLFFNMLHNVMAHTALALHVQNIFGEISSTVKFC
jgi:hypothetical protein